MNIVVVCLSSAWGGLEQVAAQDYLDLSMNHQAHFLCLKDSPIHRHLLKKKQNIPFIDIEVLPFKPHRFFDFRILKIIKKWKKKGVHLIHIHQTSLLSLFIPWVFWDKTLIIVATRHILNNHSKKGFFHRKIYERLNCLMVVSQFVRKNVLETHAIDSRKIQVVPLGLDFQKFNPEQDGLLEMRRLIRETWGVMSEDCCVIGVVGRLDPAKGQDVFIEAAAQLLKSKKAKVLLKFVIVGDETKGYQGRYLSQLRMKVHRLNLDSLITFVGFQENIPQVMRSLDIFVMPSQEEAFGLVAIEAMAMGLPVILSKGGSVSEIIINEELGITISPRDTLQLQESICFLLDNPSFRVEMGKKASQFVRTRYSREIRVENTLRIYRELLHQVHCI